MLSPLLPPSLVGCPFPVSSPRPLDAPPRNLPNASARARKAAQGDAWRMPLHCYELSSQLRDSEGLRYLRVSEQLRILGFKSNHLSCVFKLLGQKVFQDVCRTVIAKTISAVSLVLLMSSVLGFPLGDGPLTLVWQRWHLLEVSASQSAKTKSWRQRFAMGGSASNEGLRAASLLVQHTARAATHRGGEIRVSTGTLFAPPSMAWITFNPLLWRWKVLQSYPWREQSAPHITYLELLAVLNLLRRLGKEPGRQYTRALHLIDSQAGLGGLCKGRSSSQALNPLLRRIAAVLLACRLHMLWGWVRTQDNPADGPSRWKS